MNYGWAQGLSRRRRARHEAAGEGAHSCTSSWRRRILTDVDAQRNLVVVDGRMGDVYSEGVDEPAQSAALLRACVEARRTDCSRKPGRCRAAAMQGVHAVFDRRPAERSAAAERRTCELPARARHHRAVARGRSRRPVGAAGNRIHAERPRQQSPAARRPAAALHDFSRAETILRNGPPPQPTDIAEIRMLPGVTYANLARATAVMAQHASTPKHLRANYVREARDWSRRALEVLQPLTADALEGRHAQAGHRRDERSHCCASWQTAEDPDLDPRIVVEHLEHPREAEVNRLVRDQRRADRRGYRAAARACMRQREHFFEADVDALERGEIGQPVLRQPCLPGARSRAVTALRSARSRTPNRRAE